MINEAAYISRKTTAQAWAITTLLTLVCLPSTSQALDINEGWRFHQGDDAAWAAPEFDDSAWKPIEVGKAWEKAGYEDYNGYGWYRLSVVVPKSMGEGAYFKHYQKLVLSLGAVDDVDVTYFNGVKVGSMGSVPADTQGYWDKPRRYHVPPKLVRWDTENVIAVRVYDDNGDGGICTGPQTLSSPSWQQFTSVTLGLGRGDGIHDGETPMKLTAAVETSSFETIRGAIQWRVESDTWIVEDRGDPFVESTQSLSLRPGRIHNVSLQFEPPAAGFYQVTCSFSREGGGKGVSHSMMQGYAPEKMVRPTTTPDDLREFWHTAITELALVEPQYQLTPVPKGSTEKTDCFLLEMRSLGNVRIRGWFEVPKSPGPHPALLRVPGYTGTMWPAKSISDMAVLSLNIRGHGNSTDDVPVIGEGGPDFLLRGIADPKTNFYRGAIMDCLRGVDFMASRPEVDAKRIGITGGSQGGMLSLMTAALDKRIVCSAPDIPYVADTMKTFRMTYWPGSIIRNWVAADPANNTWALATETGHYFDSKNLAGWIECPVFMGVGLQDPVCPAPTNFAGYNQIRSPKECRVYPNAGHGMPDSHARAKHLWIRKQFGLVD